MGQTTKPTTEWAVHRVKERKFAKLHTMWAAVAPGCPAGPHPHRDCACQMFRSPHAAQAHIDAMTGEGGV